MAVLWEFIEKCTLVRVTVQRDFGMKLERKMFKENPNYESVTSNL